MSDYTNNRFYREPEQQQPEPPTQNEYEQIGKYQAENFTKELKDLVIRYNYSTIGDMEARGLLSAGEDILSAISKLELFKNSI